MSAGVKSGLLACQGLESEPPKHGGDLAYWQRKVGNEALNWLDLSSACNREPWPVPTVDPAMWMALPDQVALLDESERYFGRRPNAIGAGSQHIIEALPTLLTAFSSSPKGIVAVPRIGYQEHAFAWQKWGYEITHYDDLDELLTQTWSVAVVIQPNNPTGALASTDKLLNLMARAEHLQGLLVVDEAFIDPTPKQSLLAVWQDDELSESLFVLRSVGKFFGLAGARVGFAFCAAKWQNALHNLLGPWPVATPSLYLVQQAFADTVWQSHAKERLKVRQTAFMERIVPKFNTIFDSQDYMPTPLFTTWFLEDVEEAEKVFNMLHQVGLHTRLGDGWIRVAMPALDEMDELNSALIRLLKTAGGRDLA